MRTGLRRHPNATGLRLPDQFDTVSGRNVHHMQPAARHFGKSDVAANHYLLGRRRHSLEAEAERNQPLVHHPTP